MSNSWDDAASEWDKRTDVISYSEMAFESLVEVVDINGQRVLDFGCGTGLLTERMSPLARCIVAIDSSPKMIKVLQSKKLQNVVTVSESLTVELINNNSAFTQKFNIVVASSVLSFIPNYKFVLKLLRSLLVTDGVLIQWDWLQPDDDPEFGLSETTIIKTLETTGFKHIELSKPFSLTFEKGDMPVVMGVAINA